MKFFLAFVFIFLTAGMGDAERIWINSITVNEHNMTWNYNETFTGADSIEYRMMIDKVLGNNDSYIGAWELLNADKDIRKNLRKSIDNEQDVKINNETSGVEVLEVESNLSIGTIGNTHTIDTVTNIYSVPYRFRDSVLNAGSIWFLGQAKSPVTIVMPAGIDVVNISGMNNITRNVTDHVELSGYFKEITKDRGEITLYLARNTSNVMIPEINVTNTTALNTTEPLTDVLSKIKTITIFVVGGIMILLIYFFKVKKR